MTDPRPTVLVSGLSCTATVYFNQIPALWRFGSVTLADHMRGETLVEIAGNILAAAPPRFALAGFSLGGYIAFEIMRQAADRVEKLALLDTSARPETPEQAERRRERIAMAHAGRYRETLEEHYPTIVHPSRHGDAALRRLYLTMAEEYGSEAFIRHALAIMQRADSRKDLVAIACPTLVLVGDHDELTPPETAREMADGIEDALLVIVPECGHMTLIEKPDAVNKALAEWMSM